LAIRLGCGTFRSNTPPWHANFFTHGTLRGFFARYGDRLSEISIRSYGIPQAYGAYVGVHRFLRRLVGRGPKRSSGSKRVSSDRADKRFIAWLFATVYYQAGRPLKLGDKLEVMVVKAKEGVRS